MSKYNEKYDLLVSSAIDALEELKKFENQSSFYPWAESIRNQIEFIKAHAENRKNPVKELGNGRTFNYGIVSSRNLTSPDENVLKCKLDDVSENLRNVWDD
jgi:hypothetical protein|tara:strand:- start:2868 stop:3170 length:303 start_codon:yes stop_codon:yes gene_type:complete